MSNVVMLFSVLIPLNGILLTVHQNYPMYLIGFCGGVLSLWVSFLLMEN